MKTFSFTYILAIVVSLSFTTNAQDNRNSLKNQSGVYKSFSDFQAMKLDLSVDVTKEKHKIRVHDFINKSEIDVIHNDKKYTFNKKDIYGIRDVKGDDYRFFNDLEYQIVQVDTIYIYTKSKDINSSNGKNRQTKHVTEYFFSKTGDSEIYALTAENIKNAFPDDHKMHDGLDMMFKSETDLTQYDQFHKTFKIVRFLNGKMK